MNSVSKKFITSILLLSIIVILVTGVLFTFIIPKLYLPIFPIAFGFVFFITLIVHLLLLKASQGNISFFIRNFMLVTTLKLFVYLAFIGGYLYFHRKEALVFVSFFMLIYFIFTIFEVVSLQNDLKKEQQKNENQ